MFSKYSPADREIRDVFMRNLSYLMSRYEEQNQASRHGESDPEFAKIFEGMDLDIAAAKPQEMALFFQATVSAVIETVRHYQASSNPSPQG